MKKMIMSLVAGILLVGAPVVSHAYVWTVSAPCKSISYSDYQINSYGKMVTTTIKDTPYYLNNATLSYDDYNGYIYGEIDMNDTYIYFRAAKGGSQGNLIMTWPIAKAAVNCDIEIEHQSSSGTWFDYTGSAEINIAISSAGKAVVKVGSITANNSYWYSYSDGTWYQDTEDVMYRANLPAITGYLY
jgi:hypothetical protein